MSNNLAKEQKKAIITLSLVTFIFAVAWCINEICKINEKFNFEPLVTSCASFIPVVTLWWPFKPKNRSSRLSGVLKLNLHQSRILEIGRGEASFCPSFATNSDTSVHLMTRNHPNHVGSAILTNDINHFSEVKDASNFDLSGEDKSPDINDVFTIKNRFGNYALLKIIEIAEASGDTSGTEITIAYVINVGKEVNFS